VLVLDLLAIRANFGIWVKLTHALMFAVRHLPDDALGVEREVMALDKSRPAIRLAMSQ